MPSPKNIFPLPLVAFERYMLADDRPEYPMTFVMAMQLAGEIDREAMEGSLREALQRHPLLQAVIELSNARRPCWVSAGENPVVFDWDVESAPLDCIGGEPIDLLSQPGLRAWARQGENRVELTFQFHHTCCDAFGALCFVSDVLSTYGSRTASEGDRPTPRPLVMERLHERAVLGRQDESTLERFWGVIRALPLMLKFVTRRPQPLSNSQSNSHKPSKPITLPDIKRVILSEAVTKQLREASRRRGVTLNDLLLRDMFLTVADWNKQAIQGANHRWLRILMPTNLRGSVDEAMPAANMVSLSFLTRHSAECRQSDGLLDGIHEETSSIKQTDRRRYFIRVIEAAQALYGKMPPPLVGRRCRATVVLSNMGDLGQWFANTFPRRSERLVVGNLTLEGITSAPPIRPNTTAAFLAYSYADRLNVNLLCDRQVFSPQQTEQLLHEYTDRLKETSIFQG